MSSGNICTTVGRNYAIKPTLVAIDTIELRSFHSRDSLTVRWTGIGGIKVVVLENVLTETIVLGIYRLCF